MSITSFNILQIFLCMLLVKLATAENLNCTELNVTECKVQFFKLFYASFADPVEFFFGREMEVWKDHVAELPQNDKLIEPINKQISYLKALIATLKEVPPNLEILKNTAEPNFSGIRNDEASEKFLNRVQEKIEEHEKEYSLLAVQILTDFAKSFLSSYFLLDEYGPLKEELASLYKIYSDLAAALIAENMEASLKYFRDAMDEALEEALKCFPNGHILKLNQCFCKLLKVKHLDTIRKVLY